MITEKDFDSIKADGRSLELIKRQYEHLVGGKIKISGIRPAIIGDLISIPLYLYKGLAITSIQYFVFTLIAIFGYIQWLKIYYKKKQIV